MAKRHIKNAKYQLSEKRNQNPISSQSCENYFITKIIGCEENGICLHTGLNVKEDSHYKKLNKISQKI